MHSKLTIRIPKWRLEKLNGLTLSLFFVVIALENFACLIPARDYIIPGFMRLSDIGVLSALTWSLYVFLCVKPKKRGGYYSKLPVLYIIVLLLSAISAYHFFGQGISLSVRSRRVFLTSILLYYAILRALYAGKIVMKDVVCILCTMALFEIIVFSVQYFLGDSVKLIYVTIDSRYNEARVRAPYLLPLVFVYFSINEFLHDRHRILNIFFVVFGAFVLIGIGKHRANSMFFLVTLIFAYFLWKKRVTVKLFIGVICLILGISFILSSTLVQDTIDAVLHNGKTSTMGIRFEGQAYYFARLKESPWVGFAPPNENCPEAIRASGFDRGYGAADNGVIGFLYWHGIIGAIWVGALWIMLMRQAYYMYKRKQEYHYLLYFLFETGNMYIGMQWSYYYPLPFFVLVALLNYEFSLMNISTREEVRLVLK